MDDRREQERRLEKLEQEIRQLEIAYEQYFQGVEKREPLKERERLTLVLRRLHNRHIIQTDIRYRFQNLTTRFYSYSGYWDRILRLMDEGKFHRGGGKRPAMAPPPPVVKTGSAPSPPQDEETVDRIYADLIQAHTLNGLDSPPPQRKQVERFLNTQQEKIRQKFGERPVEFMVVSEKGHPRIRVRAKKEN